MDETRQDNQSLGGADRAVVMGVSAGGFEVLSAILSALPADFAWPLLVVQHLHASDQGSFAEHLDRVSKLRVVEPCDKQPVLAGTVYVAPANYHMLVEGDQTIALSTDERVNWSRPSVDVLFESAALVWGEGLVAVVLSGANADGAAGIKAVKAAGGLTMVQDPAEAEFSAMPSAAIETGAVDRILGVRDIVHCLTGLARGDNPTQGTTPPAGKVLS